MGSSEGTGIASISSCSFFTTFSLLCTCLLLILLFLVMWLFMIRPQRKQQKALEEMRKALKKGDHVVTAGGIYGVICDVDDRTVLIKVDGEVKLRVDKNSVSLDGAASAPADNGKSEKAEKSEKSEK